MYAYILNLIQSSEDAKKGQSIGFEGVRPGAKISAYADGILTYITEKHKSLLSMIEDIAAEFVAARFKEAFRLVRGDVGDMRVKQVDAEEELANQTMGVDPIYHYTATAARVFGDLPSGRSDTPARAQKEFELVMGDSLPGIVKKSRELAKDPDLAPLYSKKLVVEVPADSSLKYMYKDPRVNLYAKIYKPKETQADNAAVSKFHSMADAMKAVKATGLNTWVGGRREEKSRRHDRGRQDHGARQRGEPPSAGLSRMEMASTI